jgi:hypothetical protein
MWAKALSGARTTVRKAPRKARLADRTGREREPLGNPGTDWVKIGEYSFLSRCALGI